MNFDARTFAETILRDARSLLPDPGPEIRARLASFQADVEVTLEALGIEGMREGGKAPFSIVSSEPSGYYTRLWKIPTDHPHTATSFEVRHARGHRHAHAYLDSDPCSQLRGVGPQGGATRQRT